MAEIQSSIIPSIAYNLDTGAVEVENSRSKSLEKYLSTTLRAVQVGHGDELRQLIEEMQEVVKGWG